ncbi:MAG: ABC transporter ATP-binding protein [Planctomycetes bacterium]|nr:ABC transporter ATP-binding protein [Planctomycetota bacterium]
MIRVSELSKHFGPTVAVDKVSFEIERGEVVGFLGPNGAGKTTTIRVLTGYHPASSGTAEVAGFDVQKQSLEVRQNIGYLPQEVPIYPDLRVVEYLRYRAELKGVPARERRGAVQRAMAKAGIADVARKLVGHVSHGYRQRVGLADALVANPPILILDEPTSGLDPNQRRRIKQVVRELAEEHTILFSSHILGEVQDVSSRVIVIHRGTVRADGPPDELVARNTRAVLRVRARCAAPLLREIVEVLPGVVADTVEAYGGDDPASTTLRCQVEPGQDPTVQLGDRLQQAAIAVHELRVELPTLEEYFYSITDGLDQAEEALVDEPAIAEAQR